MTCASEIEIHYKPQLHKLEAPKIISYKQTEEFLRKIWADDIEYRERFYALFLNRNNRILGYTLISMGGVAGTVADMKMIFQPALLMHSSCIILAHNHPSGNTNPSEMDIRLTKKAIQAGEILEIKVLDHIILTSSECFSFCNEQTVNF